MSDTGKRFLGWSVESIVGNIVWSLLCALGLFYFNERTGCVYIVLDSMRGHELELAGWTIAFTLFGALVGLMVRHRIAIRQLDDKDSAAKERISSELAAIEGFKQVDSLDALVEKARELSSLNDQLAAEIAAKDAEVAELENMKREHRTLFDEFRVLNHDEQRQIIDVMLSEPGGIVPSDEQRKHMGSWVKMKDFVRHDAKTDRLHLLDGVKDMLLENPGHVYDLMAARVSDLEKSASDAGVTARFKSQPTDQQESTEQIRTPSGKLCCNMAAVKTLPTEILEAMLDAFDNGSIKFEGHEKAVRASVKRGDGIFAIGHMYFMGYQGEENGTFNLTMRWRDFMDGQEVIAEIREIVRGAGPVWHEI